MRTDSGQPQYRAPATKVPRPSVQGKKQRNRTAEDVLVEIDSEPVTSSRHTLKSITGSIDAYAQGAVKEEAGGLELRVMKNKNFTDLQKAVIMAEIFNKPKFLKNEELAS